MREDSFGVAMRFVGIVILLAAVMVGLQLLFFFLHQVDLAPLLASIFTALLGVVAMGMVAHGFARRIRRVAVEAESMSEGKLDRPPIGDESMDEIGRMARAFDRMVDNQRRIVREIGGTTAQLNSAAGQFLATARQQERGAMEQSSSVEETRRTLESLLQSGREIARTAEGVLSNAQRAQETASTMNQCINELSRQVERITEILDSIRGIASKSELLALNAALEGTKAGEAGRGFSLVAGQMQRLAENVMEAVRDMRDLTEGIREATQSSVLITEESTKLSAHTTTSARQIAMIIQQQQAGTEQVAEATDDVSQIASQTAMASKQIVSASSDILNLCERLQRLISTVDIGLLRESLAAAGVEGAPVVPIEQQEPFALDSQETGKDADVDQRRAAAEASR